MQSEDERPDRFALDNLPLPADEVLRRELQVGFDQADAGDVADWDVEEMLRNAHRRAQSPSDVRAT